jgi:hypothetical protein
MSSLTLTLAEVTGPLFGNAWLALAAALVAIALLMLAVAAVGRWLARTHPDAPGALAGAGVTAPAFPTSSGLPGIHREISHEHVLPIIAAVVRMTFGKGARIAQIIPVKPAAPSVETLMQQWSMEGRRQIYSSHQIR